MAVHKKRVLLRRGIERSIPKSAPMGELLYCKDTDNLFIGIDSGIKKLTKGDGLYDGGWFGDAASDNPSVADGGEF